MNSADDAVEVTRDIGRKQTTAYTSMSDARVKVSSNDGNEITLDIWLTLHNSGQSPTQGIEIALIDHGERHLLRDLGSGEKRAFNFGIGTHISDITFTQGSDTEIAFGIKVELKYDDVFGRNQSESKYFCGWLDLVEGNEVDMHISEAVIFDFNAKIEQAKK